MDKRKTLVALVSIIFFTSGCDDQTKGNGNAESTQITKNDVTTQLKLDKTQQPDDIEKKIKEIQANSTPEKIKKFNELKDDDPKILRESVVSEIKKKLPLLVDEATLMTDVSTDGGTFSYKYVIKGISASTMESDVWKDAMQKNIKNSYCSDDARLKVFRELFSEGVIYNYYLSDKLIYTYRALPSICS
ncbi:protein K [Klebsiella pneumoniae]|uniref:protein K n=2 Tax=Klebsiella pneumoniae TaxID=573 RepID=UPI000E64DDF9|nr:protein K [Klebsiella pneumoniae]